MFFEGDRFGGRCVLGEGRCRPRWFFPAVAACVFGLCGCTNALSGDVAVLDRFAAFEVQGMPCTPTVVGEGGLLAEATSYRYRQFALALSEVRAPSGRVRYARLASDLELRDSLRVTREQLAQVDPTKWGTRDDKLAFWLNAYNALVLGAVLDAWLADPSFRVDARDFAIFDHEVHRVGGGVYSLGQIENGILRGDRFHPSLLYLDEDAFSHVLALHDDIWRGDEVDARIHFALNCASSSCPDLPAAPLDAASIGDTLERLTQEFLRDSMRGAGPEGISQIFQFYESDFAASGGVEAFIGRYRDLSEVDTNRFLGYDWSLNLADDD